jgi:isopenicillin N synthase-like dioxygenase
MDLSAVPVVDIAPFLAGSEFGRREVARAVNRACTDIGFIIITGHGLPRTLIDAMMRVSREFFDLSIDEKLRSLPPRREHPRGYSRYMDESLAYTANQVAPPDLKEAFAIGQVDVPEDDYHRGELAGLSFAANIWPLQPAGLRQIWTEYYRAMERLSQDVMRIFAVALDLPERFFADKLDRHVSVLRALNYPNQATVPLPGQLRAGEHTDFGSLTILLQEDRPGGLQVHTRSEGWCDVHPVPDSFTVNIGDLMQIWTNDRWVSTRHRVANPPSELSSDSRRQSIAFFQQPNYDALITCLDSCRAAGEVAKYAPITSGEHMWAKIRRAATMSLDGRPA